MSNKLTKIFFIVAAFILLNIPMVSYAQDFTVLVQANDEAKDYLKDLDTNLFGTLCYDLYKVYTFENMPSDFDKEATKYANEAIKKYVGDAGSMVNESKTAAYTGLSLNQEYKIDEGIYLMVVRGTKPNTTVIKNSIVAGADSESYDSNLVTFTLLDYHMYTVKPQFIVRSDKYTLKMLADPAITSIKINKTIKKYYADVENTTFVFKVDVYFPNENTLYSSEVYSINFTGTGTKSVVVEGIPIGSMVKVYEIYKGLSYETYVGEEQTNVTAVKVDGVTPVEVTFENKYENKQNHGGGGVVNRFEFNLLEGKGDWKWEQKEGNEATVNGISDKFFEQLLNFNVFKNALGQ